MPFAKYNCEFMCIAAGLERKKLMSIEEKAQKYWKGFPTKTHYKVESRLKVQFPNKNTVTKYTFNEWWAESPT